MIVLLVVAALGTRVYITKCAACVILILYRQSTLEYSETPRQRFKGYTTFKDECKSNPRKGKEVGITERHIFYLFRDQPDIYVCPT